MVKPTINESLCWWAKREKETFKRALFEPIEEEVTHVRKTSARFNGAEVRALSGYDEAVLRALELKGVYVERVKFAKKELAAAYENLSMRP